MKKIFKKDILEYDEAPSGYIMLYNYKEPLMQFDGGYGFTGVLAHDPKKDLIQCHLCGNWFERLSNHLMKEHNMKCNQYKDYVGLNQKTALINESLRKKLIEHGQKNIIGQKNFKKNTYKRSEETKQKISITRAKNVAEMQNINGTCPMQLIDRLQKKYNELGRTPTNKEIEFYEALVKVYGSMQEACRVAEIPYREPGKVLRNPRKHTIEECVTAVRNYVIQNGKLPKSTSLKNLWNAINRFGKYKIFKEALHGKDGYIYSKGFVYEYTEEELLYFMANFFKQNKRFPSPSDSRRKLLPNASTYYNKFGSWKKAVELTKEILDKQTYPQHTP